MKNVVAIEITGLLKVNGIYNRNGSSPTYYRGENYGNMKYAKVDRDGVDYTSSGCLRFEMFKEEFPNQPNSQELKDNFVKIVGSAAGYVRGVLETDLKCKKSTSVSVRDAKTVGARGKPTTHTSVRSNSKEKETGKVSKAKGKEGQKAGDISFFSEENALEREQLFDATIVMQELERADLAGEDAVVRDKNVEEYLHCLGESLKGLGVSGKVKSTDYVSTTAVNASKKTGVLLSQEQRGALVKFILGKIAGIYGNRASASIKMQPETIKIKVRTHGSLTDSPEMTLCEFAEALEKGEVQFFDFYKAV